MRLKVLLNPLFVIPSLFLAQALFWLLFMPEVPTIPGVAPRYESEVALLKWFALFTPFVIGIATGVMAPLRGTRCTDSAVPVRTRRYIWRLISVTLLATLLGEMVYIRDVIANPELLKRGFEEGNLAIVGEEVRTQRIIGISSLNNLFILPVALLALIAMDPRAPGGERKRAIKWLWLVGLFTLFHSLFLAARMFMVYFVLVILGAYLLVNSHRRFSLKALLSLFVLMIGVIWVGELLRGGLAYARSTSRDLVSVDVQKHIFERLIQGYIAADFNNALVLLDCVPSGSLFSTTALASLLKIDASYSDCPNWKSLYGTVNVLALWWFDFGYWAVLVAGIIGWFIGFSYRIALSSRAFGLSSALYLIVYPGLFSILRINYFGLSIFLLPAATWFLAFVISQGLVSLRQRVVAK